jgi:FkbM family methyltransferase
VELSESAGLAASFIAKSGALDGAFVLVDIGVRGGIHPRWRPLEPVLEVYGFDALAEVVAPNDRHHYFKLALGDYDGQCTVHVPDNPYETRVSADGAHRVPIAKLDTLWAKGALPPADFIKIDCEGYEPEILTGAAAYLKASELLGADIESHFHVGTPAALFAFCRNQHSAHRARFARGRSYAQPRAQRRPTVEWNIQCIVFTSPPGRATGTRTRIGHDPQNDRDFRRLRPRRALPWR